MKFICLDTARAFVRVFLLAVNGGLSEVRHTAHTVVPLSSAVLSWLSEIGQDWRVWRAGSKLGTSTGRRADFGRLCLKVLSEAPGRQVTKDPRLP